MIDLGLENCFVIHNGQQYDFQKLDEPFNFSDQLDYNGDAFGTHLLLGFEEPLIVIIYNEGDKWFYTFGYILEGANLLVSLEDEGIWNRASEILTMAIERAGE